MLLAALRVLAATAVLPLTDEVFLADADMRREGRVEADAVLRAACVDTDATTPAYRLSYARSSNDVVDARRGFDVCVQRPWRVGSFAEAEQCKC